MRLFSRLTLSGLLFWSVVGLNGCGYVRYLILLNSTAKTDALPVTHAVWDGLLKKIINDQGLVNYKVLSGRQLGPKRLLLGAIGALPQ